MPHQVALPSINRGRGVATVIVLGSPTLDVSTIDPASLTLTASSADGTTSRTLQTKGFPRSRDLNGDGAPDLVLHFTRSQLKGLTGQVTIDVQGTTTADGTTGAATDFGSDTLTIFQPGHQGQGHGQGGQKPHGHPTNHGPHSRPTHA